MENNKINANAIAFSVDLHIDTLFLLLNGNPDIRQEILDGFNQKNMFVEDILDDLFSLCEEIGFDSDRILDDFRALSGEEFMNYVSFSKDDVEFNCSESQECNDRQCAVFRMNCVFDADAFLHVAARHDISRAIEAKAKDFIAYAEGDIFETIRTVDDGAFHSRLYLHATHDEHVYRMNIVRGFVIGCNLFHLNDEIGVSVDYDESIPLSIMRDDDTRTYAVDISRLDTSLGDMIRSIAQVIH